jgi:hypothetical protein
MNPSASLTASSVVFNTGSENFGVITAAFVTFQDGSANSGSVIGDAVFNGSAINRVAGLVSGNATFAATATNLGTVQGTVTIDDSAYAAWLAANTGVTQYTGAGPHNGQWAYNSTEYASQAAAQAAYDAANGGGSNWYDDSSDAHLTVTLNGSVTQSDEGGGVVAALFDGSAGYLNISNPLAFNNNPFTIELFFNPTDMNGSLWGQDNGSGNLSKLISYGNLTIEVHGSGSRIDLSSGSVISNSWNHMAVVRDDSNNVTLYVNGINVSSNYFSSDLGDITQPFNIGWAGESGIGKFNGKIAAFRAIVGTALYTSNFSVPTALPTAVSGTQLLLNFGATAVPTV